MTKSIIVAIDEQDKASFNRILDSLDPNLCMVKIGSVSFNALGHDIVYSAADKGFDIFLDLKLHDIPNTVKKSIEGLSISSNTDAYYPYIRRQAYDGICNGSNKRN